jgi:ferrous iron transport protein A
MEFNPTMFTQTFTVSGSSLKLLKPGERGIVSQLKGLNDHLSRNLREMGIRVGTSITLEKRFPRFVIKVGANCFAIDNRLMDAIYIRLGEQRVNALANSPFNSAKQQARFPYATCPLACPLPAVTSSSQRVLVTSKF